MSLSRSTIIYDVWVFHTIIADTGIAQAGVVVLHESGKAAENDCRFSVYHTSRNPSRVYTSHTQSQYELGGNMTYRGKIFGADIEPFNKICMSVESTARKFDVPLNSATDWIEIWEDQMNRVDIAHILFDRPEKRPLEFFDAMSYSQAEHQYPPSYSFGSVVRNGIAYKPQRDTTSCQSNHRGSQNSPFRKESNREYNPQHRHERIYREPESSDEDSDYYSEEEEYHKPPARSTRHHRNYRAKHSRRDDGPQEMPENKKLKYAGIIAESVIVGAIGDIFQLVFESVIGGLL